MIVDHSPSTGLRLPEAADFGGFDPRPSGSAEAGSAIDGVRFIGDGNVPIGVDLVPGSPGAPDTADWRRAAGPTGASLPLVFSAGCR